MTTNHITSKRLWKWEQINDNKHYAFKGILSSGVFWLKTAYTDQAGTVSILRQLTWFLNFLRKKMKKVAWCSFSYKLQYATLIHLCQFWYSIPLICPIHENLYLNYFSSMLVRVDVSLEAMPFTFPFHYAFNFLCLWKASCVWLNGVYLEEILGFTLKMTADTLQAFTKLSAQNGSGKKD